MPSAFSSLRRSFGLRSSPQNLRPKTSRSSRRPSAWPARSSPPRTPRRWPSLTTAARSVSGRRSILNRKARSSTSSERTSMRSLGNPQTCWGFRGRSPSTNSTSSLGRNRSSNDFVISAAKNARPLARKSRSSLVQGSLEKCTTLSC